MIQATVRGFLTECSVSKYFGNCSFLPNLCDDCLLRNCISKSACGEDTGYIVMFSYSSIFTVLGSDSVRWCPSITITCLPFELGNDSHQSNSFRSTNAVAVMLKGDRRKMSGDQAQTRDLHSDAES